jgi:hypothetical protein
MKTYKIIEKTKRSVLWGDTDSSFFFEDIKASIEIESNESLCIELDLKGIKSIDHSFINEVFIKLINDNVAFNDTLLVFSNIENDAILYYLNQSFQRNNLFAHVKINHSDVPIGTESCFLAEKLILH